VWPFLSRTSAHFLDSVETPSDPENRVEIKPIFFVIPNCSFSDALIHSKRNLNGQTDKPVLHCCLI
jgi:hypothetical protein